MAIAHPQDPCAALEEAFRNQLHAIVFLVGEGRNVEAIGLAKQGPWRPHGCQAALAESVDRSGHTEPTS